MRKEQIKVSEEDRTRAEGRAKEVDQHLAHTEAEITRHMRRLRDAHAQRDALGVEKEQLELKLKAVPSPWSVVEDFRKFEEFVNCVSEVMKA